MKSSEIAGSSLPKNADVVVVGAGLGGLICGLELSRQGKRVCVLEKHRVAGGYAHSFRRRGYHFDVSLHHLGGLRPGSLTHGILYSLGAIHKLSLHSEKHLLHADYPGFSVKLPNDRNELIEQLCKIAPGERKGIEKLFEFLLELKHSVIAPTMDPAFSISHSDDSLVETYADSTFQEVLKGFVTDEKVLAVLGQLWEYIGLPPSKSSATFSTCVFSSGYIEGSCYLKGGGAALSRVLVESIREHGGDCHTGVEVDKIVVENGSVVGVETKDGDFIRSSSVVSATNPYHTSLGKNGDFPFSIRHLLGVGLSS